MSRRGSVLIAATWMLAVVFLAGISLSYHAAARMRSAKNALRGAASAAVLQSAVNWTLVSIEDGCKGGEMALPARWKEKIEMECLDEDSKLDMNAASFEQLEHLLGERAAKAIMDYRVKKHFEHIEELALVAGLETRDLKTVKDYFTTYSLSHRLNLNTAADKALEAVVMTLPGAGEAVKAALYRAVVSVRESGTLFETEDLEPGRLSDKLGLSASPETMSALQTLIPFVTDEATVFRVRIRHQGRQAEALIGPDRQGGRGILFWHESGVPYAA